MKDAMATEIDFDYYQWPLCMFGRESIQPAPAFWGNALLRAESVTTWYPPSGRFSPSVSTFR
jgi:hypothetical protein